MDFTKFSPHGCPLCVCLKSELKGQLQGLKIKCPKCLVYFDIARRINNWQDYLGASGGEASTKRNTGWPRSYRKYILQITQHSQYGYAKLQYRFAVTSGSPSTYENEKVNNSYILYCRSTMEPYYGHTGAFRCLVEGGGDVAFVKADRYTLFI